jgi:type I restriction enzyme, S subunit
MEKQMNIPQLRFPEFKDKWNEEKMGEIYSFKVTNSFSRDNLNYEEGTVKNIHYGDIHTKFQTLFDITKETVPFINSEISIDRISEDNYCKEGDLILADASEDLNDVGKSIEIFNLNNEKILAGLHTILARPNLEKLDIGFGGYLFKSNKLRTKIQKEAQGSKVLSISATRLTNISLDFPSKDEQKKIVECFSSIDEKIQALKKKHSLLEYYKKGVMQKLFSQELRFKDENGNDFPEWEESKLGELGSFFSGGTPLTTKREYFNGNIPFIRSGEIYSNSTEQYISEEGLANSSAKMVEIGDLIYALYGATSGEVAISKIKGAINQAILCIRTSLYNTFLLYYLTLNKEIILKTYLQGGQGNLSADIIKSLIVPVPHLTEQLKIANFISAISSKIELINDEIIETENWKKGLLQKMFC